MQIGIFEAKKLEQVAKTKKITGKMSFRYLKCGNKMNACYNEKLFLVQ